MNNCEIILILTKLDARNNGRRESITAKRIFIRRPKASMEFILYILHCREMVSRHEVRASPYCVTSHYTGTLGNISAMQRYTPSALDLAVRGLEPAGKAGISRLNAIITRTYYL